MARHTSVPRFRLNTGETIEESLTNVDAEQTSSNMSHFNQQQRLQNRNRRSACSDLQSTAIPEGRVYNGNRRRASLFVGRSTPATVPTSSSSSGDQELSEHDYVKLCRQRCQSLYKSLANRTSPTVAKENLPRWNSNDNDDEEAEEEEEDVDDEDDEASFRPPARTNYRYSLPDASPAAFALKNFLKRNKTTKHRHIRLKLPSHSSSPSVLNNSSSPISTFRHFLSLVKLPSSKSTGNSTASHHSSLTTLTNATGGSSTTLDQTLTSIPSAVYWYFKVR